MTCAMKPEVDALMGNYAGDVPQSQAEIKKSWWKIW